MGEEVGSGEGRSEGGRERGLGPQIVHYMHDSSSEQSSCHKLHNRGQALSLPYPSHVAICCLNVQMSET